MMIKNHPFHLVTYSPWPLLLSFSLMNMLISMVIFFVNSNWHMMIFNLIVSLLIMFQWWRDVLREGLYQGCHTSFVYKGLRFGMMLFIISEIFFFLGFFWAYFHMALAPSIEIGMVWPPKGIKVFNPFDIPLLNTIILISSGITVTWSHYSLINNKMMESLIGLFLTVILGIYFLMMQMVEYYESYYTISDSVFGSVFFMLTGFHGLHVLVGTIFLLINLIRMNMKLMNPIRHFGYESAIWYWHFVDVVWLFLYLFVYCWVQI